MTKRKPNAKHGPFHGTHKVHWIPDFIRQERVQQGLTLVDLANKVGVLDRHISKYETGYFSIRAVFMLEKILAALGYELRIHKVFKKRI